MEIKPLDLAIKLGLYTVMFFFLIPQWRGFVRSVRNSKLILLPVPIAIVSATWSQYPSLTLRGGAVLAATTAFGVYFGTRYTISQQLRLLTWPFVFIVILSFCFSLFLPMYGVEQRANIGDWQGVFIQKNNLAEAVVLAFFVFLFVRPRSAPSTWLGIAACLALLVLSGSVTGIIVCLLILATIPLYGLVKARFTLVIPAVLGIGLVLIGLLLMLKTDTLDVLQILHRRPDLTGRTELWDAVLDSIWKRPWLGYGFNAFWEGMNGESESVLKTAGWMAGYAHNGFLDLILQIGFVGLVTFALGFVSLWKKALGRFFRSPSPASQWLCTFLVFMLLYNLTEGYILVQNSIYWVLYISAGVTLFSTSNEALDCRS